MWHKMTLMGKILLIFVGFGFGMAAGIPIGIKYAKANEGNQVTNNYDIKAKKGAVVNTENSTEQNLERKEEEEERKWWWPF